MAANSDNPVGVFDSGIGGLTVLQKNNRGASERKHRLSG
jgi:glutamate racemase